MTELEFLNPPLSAIRRNIKGIDDSYRNPWDILAELTQNAVDAIRKMQKNCIKSGQEIEKGTIELEINALEKSIRIVDNGCGMSAEELPKLLNLYSSDKDSDSSQVGEKGVGLKFAYFQSKFFEISTSDGRTGGCAKIRDARLWKEGNSDIPLRLEFEENANLPHGTMILLKDVKLRDDNSENDKSIFELTLPQMRFVLRNVTYLGNTSVIWDPDFSAIDIKLFYTDCNGKNHQENIKNEYILPTEAFPEKEVVNIDTFEKWLHEADRSDAQKRTKLQGRVLVVKGTYMHRGFRNISYWACFVPSRRVWDQINKSLCLTTSEEEVSEQYSTYYIFKPGIYVATKGMPTGITVDTPATGNAGYWPNFFMIFQDDTVNFDIGRKSIHPKIQAIYQGVAKKIFSQITAYVTKYTSSAPIQMKLESAFDRDEVIEETNKMLDLDSKKVTFIKNPADSEAAVAAIFFELIGNGGIKDIRPIYTGYQNKYDLYAYFTNSSGKRKFSIIEFKSHLHYITKDFPDATKVFDEMNYIVCWGISDEDLTKLHDFGIECEKVVKNSLYPEDIPDAVTHRLTAGLGKSVYVIDLKEIVL